MPPALSLPVLPPPLQPQGGEAWREPRVTTLGSAAFSIFRQRGVVPFICTETFSKNSFR